MTCIKRLSETKALWLSFSATILITAIFQGIVHQFDLVLLDTFSDLDEIRSAIAAMSERQRELHALLTSTLDVAYPAAYAAYAAYAALFIGSAYKFFPAWGFFLAISAMVCIPIDLAEGVVQVLALVGNIDWLSAKGILTPLKDFLVLTGLLITMAGWVKWLLSRVRGAKLERSE